MPSGPLPLAFCKIDTALRSSSPTHRSGIGASARVGIGTGYTHWAPLGFGITQATLVRRLDIPLSAKLLSRD